MTTEVKRSQRVGERVREELALLLRTLSDPRIAGVVVTRVEISDDLSFVRAFVRRDAGASEAEQKSLLRGLEAASGRIRRDVTRSVGLRVAPGFRFLYDEGIDAQHRIEELLKEIEKERPKPQ
ncbi:MAG: 30S ribosome-binding factor RbfA [Polyangiaceae bacterium]|jgi:ribosome-binding factor A|nr:30S ribosome-binding factor RbfA [Polyangiaceae bacterium]